MAHQQQQEFCNRIRQQFPELFSNKNVLDIGSLDINGNNRYLFDSCNYIGLDLGEGPNVDVVAQGNKYNAPDESFDFIISTEVFEHDMFYEDTIKNIIRMLKPGGVLLFTCASKGRPEHGTRRSDGSGAAPLLGQVSDEWSDYYKNLEEQDIHNISGFDFYFPDGVFEYNPNPGDLYFFGIKEGIKNTIKYHLSNTFSIIKENEYPDDIFVVDTWPNTESKENDLIECINRLKQFSGIPILLVSHYAIKPEIQKLVDYYLFVKDNPLLTKEEFKSYNVASGRWTRFDNYLINNELEYHHDYAIWTSMKHAFNFCDKLGRKTIHFMEYDCLLDTFQYRQTFLENMKYYDAILYEYHTDSSIDKHLSAYCATFLFSIKTHIALKLVNDINSKHEYFTNRPQGWQLERVFLSTLRKFTKNIKISEYIDNKKELNTQATWNRDGIYRNGAKFQVYLGVDNYNHLYVHFISGFHEEPATEDYLLEIIYDGFSKFEELKYNTSDKFKLINIGKYNKGKTVEVRYLGQTVFTEFLNKDVDKFRSLNHVTFPNINDEVMLEYNFVNGAYVKLTTELPHFFQTEFRDKSTNKVHYSTQLENNYWAKCSTSYYADWNISAIDQSGNIVESIDQDLFRKKVLISLESKSLGDTLAWFPYVEEFRKKHECHIVCSTFWNQFFKDTYPDIEFIEPGTVVNNIYAAYKIGWFLKNGQVDHNMNPVDFKTGPLQKTASDILGLPFQEIKPIIKYPERKITNKVGIGIHSTAQAKYWNNPLGWQTIIDWLVDNGYEPILLSKEENGFMGNYTPVIKQLPAGPIENVIAELTECQAFVGISSGLSWLAWVTNTPTVLISGFTEPFNEPNEGIIKVSAPESVCSGCSNKLTFDPGDWNWCPIYKGTDRQFECSKTITPDSVINALKQILQ